MEPLHRIETSVEERLHDQAIKELNEKYPLLDPLMCSVILKCPKDLLLKLVGDPAMWIVPDQTSTLLSGQVTISDPELSPRSPLI